jgi:hypothetical protein
MPRKLLTLTFLALASLFAMPSNANACSCLPETVSDSVHNADIVFRGAIIDIRDVQSGVGIEIGMGVRKRIAVFRVNRVWKGDVGEAVEMLAIEDSGGLCRRFPKGSLAVGNELLVYASRQADSHDYITNICSRTSLAIQTKDFHELGRGRVPKKVD